MIIMNSKYYPPHIVSRGFKDKVVLSTIPLTGLYCESSYNFYGSIINSSVTYANNNGSLYTIDV